MVRLRQAKGRARAKKGKAPALIEIQVLPELKARLNAAADSKRSPTIVTSEHTGLPYSRFHFNRVFREVREHAALAWFDSALAAAVAGGAAELRDWTMQPAKLLDAAAQIGRAADPAKQAAKAGELLGGRVARAALPLVFELHALATKQFLDIRRSSAVRLAEAGCTTEEVVAITGHDIAYGARILETYIPRTAPMGRNAIAKLGDRRRTKSE